MLAFELNADGDLPHPLDYLVSDVPELTAFLNFLKIVWQQIYCVKVNDADEP